MPLRTAWKFTFPASEIETAAKIKQAHHVSRVEKYQAELEQVKTMPEDVVQGNPAWTAQPQSNKQIQMNNIFAKIQHHQQQAEGYDKFAAAMYYAKFDGILELDVDDIAYFWGAN